MTRRDFICFPFFFFLHSDNLHWLLLLSNPFQITPKHCIHNILWWIHEQLAGKRKTPPTECLTDSGWLIYCLTDRLTGRPGNSWAMGRSRPGRRPPPSSPHHHHQYYHHHCHLSDQDNHIPQGECHNQQLLWLHVISLLTTMICDHETGGFLKGHCF